MRVLTEAVAVLVSVGYRLLGAVCVPGVPLAEPGRAVAVAACCRMLHPGVFLCLVCLQPHSFKASHCITCAGLAHLQFPGTPVFVGASELSRFPLKSLARALALPNERICKKA